MDPESTPRRLEGGFASLQFVIAAALAMLLVVGLLQVVSYQYVRGAALTAAQRAVRAGSVAGEAACGAALADSLSEVLGGEVGESLVFGCEADAATVRAEVEGTLPAWLAGGPDLGFRVEAVAVREVEP